MLSMHYFDYCYLLEQGQIVNEQNVGFTEEITKSRNWNFSVMLTETFGVRDIEGNKQQLLLESEFEKKHLLQKQLQSNE